MASPRPQRCAGDSHFSGDIRNQEVNARLARAGALAYIARGRVGVSARKAGAMQRRTIIVDGPLAFAMRRIEAARAGEIGADIMTMPLVAARLAGGFARPALAADIEQDVRAALDAGGFKTLQTARDLPGFVRAAAQSLAQLWEEGESLAGAAIDNAQAADVALLEARVRAALPAGVMGAVDLRDAALDRIAHARAVLGSFELDRVFYVAPVWRPLLAALQDVVPVAWRDRPSAGADWFQGHSIAADLAAAAAPDYLLCANPRAEAVEALRWMRSLLASGVSPSDIAIAAASTEPWDDHFQALAHDGGLPLHFAHGLPALATQAGQGCAALADLLLRGLNQERFRRLAGYAAGQSRLLGELPHDWRAGLSGEARLADPAQWRAALAAAVAAGHADVRAALLPAIDLLARGKDAAAEAGAMVLPPAAQPIWASALRRAPAAAIEQALSDIRFADDSDPGASVVWTGAQLLAGAPRKHVRLLGLASRSWPRRGREDPLLPPHIFSRTKADALTPVERDRAAFAHLCARASGSCIVSRSRRNAQGARQAPSPLVAHVPRDEWRRLRRDRRPEHAFNEADRLMARPIDRARDPRIASASACFANRRKSELTPHDGGVAANHKLILAALARAQSATSLRTMLRDPLGYVWRYVLDWEAPRDMASGLALDPRAYGELLHDLLRRTVQELAGGAGFAHASADDVARAAAEAARVVERDWPLRKATPPPLLWRHTLDLATAEACVALKLAVGEGTQSWAEIGFGRDIDDGAADLPWRPSAAVVLDKSSLKVTGFIDRLDRRPNGDCRVTDYKTGAVPPQVEFTILGGEELQRVLYTLVVRQLLPDAAHVTAVLLYLRSAQTDRRAIEDMDPTEFLDAVAVAAYLLRSGRSIAGIDAFTRFNEYAIALPAASEGYQARKSGALGRALSDLASIWGVE